MAVKRKPTKKVKPAPKKPATRKPTPSPANTPAADRTPSVVTSTTRTGLTREIAVADPRFGLGYSGFYRQVQWNPDDLIGRQGLQIYSKMRRDEQVKAALMTKKLATIASGWEIAIEDKEREEDEALDEQKSFVEFNLREMEGTVESYLLDMLTALDYGYSVTEPCYKLLDYGDFKGKYGFKALKVRRPEQIEFETDQFGNLLEYGIRQGQQPLPANRFGIFTYRKEFGNFYGNSDLREAYRCWFMKDALARFMAMACERFGQPIAVATTESTISEQDKTTLLNILNNIQARTGIVLPNTIELEIKDASPHVSDVFIPVLNKLDEGIALAILMPSLIGMGGGNEETGSYARSETEMDTFLWVVENLRNQVQEFVNDRLIKVLIDLNYDVEDGVYPRFKFKELTHERKIEILDRFEKALTAQAITKTREDEEFYRSLAGMPELPEEEVAAGTREAMERDMKDQVDMAGKMAKAAPAVPPAPATKDKGPERNPFQPKAPAKPPAKFGQRDDLPRVPGGHKFAGRDDAPRDFDEKCLNSMIKRGQSLGYDEESLNFVAGFMAAPASKYQSLNEMVERGAALKMDQRTIEFAMGFLGESLDLEKREKEKEKAYHQPDNPDHDQDSHGNRGDDLADRAINKGGFTYNPVRLKHRAPRTGFALSTRKDTEKVFDATIDRDKLKAQIKAYVKKHRETIKAEGNYLGGWLDPKSKKIFIDISTVIKDRKEAIELAKRAKQLAIYDLDNKETIDIAA